MAISFKSLALRVDWDCVAGAVIIMRRSCMRARAVLSIGCMTTVSALDELTVEGIFEDILGLVEFMDLPVDTLMEVFVAGAFAMLESFDTVVSFLTTRTPIEVSEGIVLSKWEIILERVVVLAGAGAGDFLIFTATLLFDEDLLSFLDILLAAAGRLAWLRSTVLVDLTRR